MRVYALSDIHVDYDVNARWVEALSRADHQDDVLILAGDVSDSILRLGHCVESFARRFRKVFFVPGNHDVWVLRDRGVADSLRKFEIVQSTVASAGASTVAEVYAGVSFVPLLSWYDLSFGSPSTELMDSWMDFRACRWPPGWGPHEVTNHFLAMNDVRTALRGDVTISFSHFLPRIDVMPGFIGPHNRRIYPVLGSQRLGDQVLALGPDIHVYGHSHVNRSVVLDGIHYVNNAFAYPHEDYIAAKALRCIHSSDSSPGCEIAAARTRHEP
jgi:predicted phosphodiesterase